STTIPSWSRSMASRYRSWRSTARCGSGASSMARCWTGCCGRRVAIGRSRAVTRTRGHEMAWTLPEDCVLGIFGKQPEPGRVKSRLAVEWGPDVAAEIQEAMLFDTLETWDSEAVLGAGGRRVLVYAPDDAGPWFDDRVPASFALQPQVDGDLG